MTSGQYYTYPLLKCWYLDMLVSTPDTGHAETTIESAPLGLHINILTGSLLQNSCSLIID